MESRVVFDYFRDGQEWEDAFEHLEEEWSDWRNNNEDDDSDDNCTVEYDASLFRHYSKLCFEAAEESKRRRFEAGCDLSIAVSRAGCLACDLRDEILFLISEMEEPCTASEYKDAETLLSDFVIAARDFHSKLHKLPLLASSQ